MSPHPHLGSFWGNKGEKPQKKNSYYSWQVKLKILSRKQWIERQQQNIGKI